MRDITQLHPRLQEIIPKLKLECEKKGITIGIGECLRTKKEQDNLYAQGRTKSGSIITNCKGSTYSSMHQWGVAFDFYLVMDIDGDGKTSDDAFNNSKKTFEAVGKIGKKLGLEWGGDWKSIVDRPHFQLPDWGSTASKLKKLYGKPEEFFATWEKKSSSETKKETEKEEKNILVENKTKVDYADYWTKKYAKTFKTKANLNLRSGAGTKKSILNVIPKGAKVTCFGYYSTVNGAVWLLVQYGKYTGFVSKKYLK